MRKALVIFISLLSYNGFSQITLDQNHYDLGEIYKGNKRLAEFNLMNNSLKKIYVLRVDKDLELETRFSTKTIEPGAYATIRIQINPRSTGKFEKKVNLWISSSQVPYPLEIIGDVKELEISYQPCPGFAHPDKIQPIQFDVTATISDIDSKLPIENATIQMVRNGIPLEELLISDNNGIASKNIPLGLYYVIAKADGYETEEFPVYLNRTRNKIMVKLKSLKNVEDLAKPIETIIAGNTEKNNSAKFQLPSEIELQGFSPENYAANNIVFLIDVSGSMRKEGRLDLLKASMLELLSILRDIDKVSILTYTSTSKMVMESLNATETNKILMKNIIIGLEAKGSTQGGQALRSAFEIVKLHFVTNGSNQVVMATDGRFGENFPEMLKVVKTNNRRKRNISVIGIKNSERSASQMREIVASGSGYYINMDNFYDAQENLVKGIKSACLKK